jgi:hypothetical protein
MANFCGSCGSPVGEKSGFCGNCGAHAGQVTPRPAMAAPPLVAMPPARGRISGLKIVLAGLGVLFVLGVFSVAGVYFTARRYVKIAENVTGVKASDVVSSIHEAATRSNEGAHQTHRDGCLLLSKEEASAILGIDVERVDGKPNDRESAEHCDFFVKPASIEQNLENFKQAATAIRDDPSSPARPNQLPAGAEDMIKTMHRGVIEGATNGEAPYFGFVVERENGKIAFTAFQMADRLSGVAALSEKASEPLGLGDKAALGMADSRLCVVQGSSAITLDLSQVTGGRAKGVELARKILSRL